MSETERERDNKKRNERDDDYERMRKYKVMKEGRSTSH